MTSAHKARLATRQQPHGAEAATNAELGGRVQLCSSRTRAGSVVRRVRRQKKTCVRDICTTTRYSFQPLRLRPSEPMAGRASRPGEGERLYAAASALDKELRASRAAPGDAAVAVLRQRLCEAYEAVLFTDYSFAQVRARHGLVAHLAARLTPLRCAGERRRGAALEERLLQVHRRLPRAHPQV